MNYIVLSAGTVLIIIFSWYFSIREKRYHGFARFFSFQSIFILLLLNLHIWFRDPFSLHQILSWIFLIASIFPGIAGFVTLWRKGEPVDNHLERTSVLVKTGVYRFIRHPLYCSLLLLGTGIMFKDPGTIQVILGIINLIAIRLTARTEEKEMLSKFGMEYRQYMGQTKMFIPFIW